MYAYQINNNGYIYTMCMRINTHGDKYRGYKGEA